MKTVRFYVLSDLIFLLKSYKICFIFAKVKTIKVRKKEYSKFEKKKNYMIRLETLTFYLAKNTTNFLYKKEKEKEKRTKNWHLPMNTSSVKLWYPFQSTWLIFCIMAHHCLNLTMTWCPSRSLSPSSLRGLHVHFPKVNVKSTWKKQMYLPRETIDNFKVLRETTKIWCCFYKVSSN